MLFVYQRAGLEHVLVLMMISSLGMCVLVMANMLELSNRIDHETLAGKEYDRVQPNYNQTKGCITCSSGDCDFSSSFDVQILFLNSQTDLGKLVGEILSKTGGLSYWENPFQVAQ